MRRRKDLDRPLRVKFGVPVAIFLCCFTAVIAYSIFVSDWQAGVAWYAAVGIFILYDAFIVPRTKRGGHYRAQVLRRRTSAARL
jgi:amino acid transporter